MKDWKEVTKEEFDSFIQAYPAPLERNVTGICDPPLLSYNDFSDGKVWPKSMVGRVVLNESYGDPNKYSIFTE